MIKADKLQTNILYMTEVQVKVSSVKGPHGASIHKSPSEILHEPQWLKLSH